MGSVGKRQRFDEQIQFVSTTGRALANFEYTLRLADGTSVHGKTDKQGNTQRVETPQPIGIIEGELRSPMRFCCARHVAESGSTPTAVTFPIEGVQTHPVDIGSSVATVTPVDKWRPLTAGEIAMARLVFQDAIDYGKVKVHNGEYLPFGLQDDNTAMTPNGEIYFNPKHFLEDFSKSPEASTKIWFIHELVHVWQYQLGYSVMLQGILLHAKTGDAYAYAPDPATHKTLPDFNMEQQGDIISRYFGAQFLKIPSYASQLPFFNRVLVKFLANPKDVSLLPK